MERGERMFHLIHKISAQVTDEAFQMHHLVVLLEETIAIFRAFPEYSDHVTALPRHFGRLSTEIVHDVIAAAAEVLWAYKRNGLELIGKVDGLWGETGRKATEKENALLTYRDSRFYDSEEKEFSLEEARNRFIKHARINENVDFDQLSAVAPNLFGTVIFQNVPDIPADILNLIGNRFSSVLWRIEEGNCADIRPEVAHFLKRQLRSKHLTTLTIVALGLQPGELDDLLLEFVKRPFFSSLSIRNGSGYPGGYPLPFTLFKEAYENWRSKTNLNVENWKEDDDSDFGRQDIRGSISQETLKQLEEYFQTSPLGFIKRSHNVCDLAKMGLTVAGKSENFRTFFSLFVLKILTM